MVTKNTRPTTEQCPSCGNYCNAVNDLDEQDYCNDCRPATPSSLLVSELAKFMNGTERYANKAVFKEALDSLAGGVGVYAVLDSLIRRLDSQRVIQATQKEEIKILTYRLKKYENI